MQVSIPKNLIRRRSVNRPWVTFAKAVFLANVWLLSKVAIDAMAGGILGGMIGAIVFLFNDVLGQVTMSLGLACGFLLGGVIGLVNGFRVLIKDASEEFKQTKPE